MIKINFNDKRIYLIENHRTLIDELQLKNAFIVFELNAQKLYYILDQLMVSDIQHFIIEGNIETNLSIISSSLSSITAAGGLVFNSKNEVLFIYRRKKWDLPKGKLDPGESIEECALREVKEETGVQSLVIQHQLLTTYHFYLEDTMIFKTTYWYKMTSDDLILIPQEAEGIKKALWIHLNNIQFQLNNTYESIQDLFRIV
jgi:ADP-ribose pyrophosphatase YjhB (NUDIX family)